MPDDAQSVGPSADQRLCLLNSSLTQRKIEQSPMIKNLVVAGKSRALTRLSGLTRAAAVVLTAKSNSRLKHIEFVRLEPEKALVVLVNLPSADSQAPVRVASGRLGAGLPSRDPQ